MTYKHITKEWEVLEVSNQVKNVIDYTEKINKGIKEKNEHRKKETIYERTDRELFELNRSRWVTSSFYFGYNPIAKKK